jgi:hypothetical protein
MRHARGLVIALATVGCGHQYPRPGAEDPLIIVLGGVDMHMRSQVPTNACLLVGSFDQSTSNVVDALQSANVRLIAQDAVAMRVVDTGRKDGWSQVLLATERDLRPYTQYTLDVQGLPPALDRLWRDGTGISRHGNDALMFETSGQHDSTPPKWKSQPRAGEVEVQTEGRRPHLWKEVGISSEIDEETATLAFLITLAGPHGPSTWFEGADSRPAPRDQFGPMFDVDAPKGERRVATITALDVACNRSAPAVVEFTVP